MSQAKPFGDLPYGPVFSRGLPVLHRGFLILNRYLAAPALRAGLGPLFANPVSGSLMLLRTRGRTSGRIREAPLGYIVRDGSVWCVAGFGPTTHWYRNVLADPRVECVLPAVTISGIAEPVTDPTEWAPAYRALIESMGVVGRLTVGDLASLSNAQLDRHRLELPLVRIRTSGLAPGAFDPGGLGWVPVFALWAWFLVRFTRVVRRAGRSRPRRRGG